MSAPFKAKASEQVRHATDVANYLDQRLGGHGGHWPELEYACPFCIDRKGSESAGKKLRVNVVKMVGTCFRCGYGFKKLTNLFFTLNKGKILATERELLKGVVDHVYVSSVYDQTMTTFFASDAPAVTAAELRPVPLPKEYVPLWGNVRPWHRHGLNYLLGRGMTAEAVGRFKVGYCSEGRYAGRVVFPVYQNGAQVYFTTRYCGNHKAKSLNPPNEHGAYHKTDVLLNYDRCVGVKRVAVVEGALDTVAAAPAVGMLGKRIGDRQIGLLKALAKRGTTEFVLGLDPDASEEEYATYSTLLGVLPGVSYAPIRGGDAWDNRDRMPAIMDARRPMNIADVLEGMLWG